MAVSGQRGKRAHNYAGGRFVTEAGYVKALDPAHPNADPRGYVFEHVRVAARVLGGAVPRGVVVHHINEQKTDNRPENLAVFPDAAYHNLIHARMAALAACGHPDWRKCAFCGQWDDPSRLYINPGAGNARHRACFNTYQNEARARRALVSDRSR